MFAKIKAEYFLSWEKLEFDFTSGVTLISGQNLDDGRSEGAGKSAIPNALCWALYGQVPKDINIDEVIKTGHKSSFVVIELQNGTQIVRSRKPNELYIKKGDQVITGKDVKETQKLINDLVGLSFDTFCQSVYFAQNYNNKFITATQENKAVILSELQDLSIFDRASKKASDKLKDAKNELQKITASLNYKTGILDVLSTEYDSYLRLSDTFDTDKLKELEDLIEKQDLISKNANKIHEEISSLGDLDSLPAKSIAVEQTRALLHECQNKLYLITSLVNQKQQALASKSCPTCGQDMPSIACEDLQIPDSEPLVAQSNTLKDELIILDSEYRQLLDKKHRNTLLIEKLKNLKEQELALLQNVNKLEAKNNPYISKILELDNKIIGLKGRIEELKQQLSVTTKEVSHLDFLKTGFKDIKSYVFQGLLAELNNKANKYLRELFEVPVYITFGNLAEDGEIGKITTSITLNGHERSLGLLSGGQSRRVQLAVDFALSDIVSQRSKNPINVRILDEAFKDLDEISMEQVIDILQKMNGSTVLIEHNSLIKNIVNNVYQVELKNATSRHI